MAARLVRLLMVLALLAGIATAVYYREQFSAEALEQWVAQFGAAGPLLFMLAYAAGTVLFLPGSVLTLAGGAIFGPVWGTVYNLTGATFGATLAFLVARYLAADWAERHSHGRLQQLKTGVEAEGWRFVAFLRLVPLFPFNALNYALGLTRIKLTHYIIASYLCMFPGAVAYTWLGYAGREAVAGSEGAIQKGLLALALLAMVAFLPRLIGRLRRGPMLEVDELKERMDGGASPLVLDVRSPEEFIGESGHIAGAMNIPLSDLKQRITELGEAMERPIAIVCRTDMRSAKAAALLAKQGFTEVHVVHGGINAWNARHYPIEH